MLASYFIPPPIFPLVKVHLLVCLPARDGYIIQSWTLAVPASLTGRRDKRSFTSAEKVRRRREERREGKK